MPKKKTTSSTTEKKTTRRTSATKRTPRPKKSEAESAMTAPSQDERHQMIAEAAYYRAMERGFCDGDPTEDWLQAEADVSVDVGATTSEESTTASRRSAAV